MNGRDVLLMKTLTGQLQGWLDVIKRGTAADKVEIVPKEAGREFAIVISYRTKDGQAHTFESYFSRERVFGVSLRGAPLTWCIQKRGCDYAREVLREVLEHRKVI
jgi:hypothetical protein